LTDFSGKTVGKFSVRPLDIHCCLKADSTESGYFKAVSEAVFDSLLGTCKAIATELAFPEIVTPTIMQLKTFIKKSCKNAEVSKKYKTLIEKVSGKWN
jgi:nucleolar complex protein 2